MTEKFFAPVWKRAAAVAIVAACAVLPWGLRVAGGVLAGSLWNLTNLWCLTRLLNSWLGANRSTRRVVAWLLIKFPLLYLLAVGLLQHPSMSLVGFSIGFSAVLVSAIIVLALRARTMVAPVPLPPSEPGDVSGTPPAAVGDVPGAVGVRPAQRRPSEPSEVPNPEGVRPEKH